MVKKNYYLEVFKKNNEVIINSAYPPRGRILDKKGRILVDNKGIKTLIYHKLPNIRTNDELELVKSIAKIIKFKDIKLNIDEKKEYYYILFKDEIDALVDEFMQKKFERRELSSDEFLKYKYSLITESDLKKIDNQECYIYHKMNKGYIYQDKVIKSNITDEEMTKLEEANLEGMRVDIRWERTYNYDTGLNSLFGTIGSIPKEDIDTYLENGYEREDLVGVSFLEKYYENYLKGIKGKYRVNKDNTLTRISEDSKGNDLILNIDIDTQMRIEEILKKEIKMAKRYPGSKYYQGSYIIVSNPRDGAIEAFVALKLNGDTFNSDVIGLLTNSYTVGSVVKGASQSVAYINGALDEDTRMRDACVKLYSQKEKCSWKSLGMLNDIEALTYSSNYFQFVNAIKVSGYKYKYNMKFNPTVDDFNKYRDVFKAYGLGVKSEIDLGEESLGITGRQITGDLLLNLAIGQYDTYTPLMLSSYIGTLANGGIRNKLRLAKGIIDNEGRTRDIEPNILNKVDIDAKYMERIQRGLHNVVIKGTASGYFANNIDGAGKTGTSETFFMGKKTLTRSFVGYFPYDDPEYTITIISPNVESKNNVNTYNYPINSRLSRQITQILFEK